MRLCRDSDLILTGSHRFDDYRIEARGVKKVGEADGRSSQAPRRTTGRNAANEDCVISIPTRHTNAVSECCATGERAGGVDREHRHSLFLIPKDTYEPVNNRALARAGRSGDTDSMGGA